MVECMDNFGGQWGNCTWLREENVQCFHSHNMRIPVQHKPWNLISYECKKVQFYHTTVYCILFVQFELVDTGPKSALD